MKPIKYFEEFIHAGIVKQQAPDRSRAQFLSQESEKAYSFLKKMVKQMGIHDENANSIIRLSYDIVMELIRADMFSKGFHSSGQGAHEAEVSYLRKIQIKEVEVQFVDQLRYFRNGILYYGKIVDKDYAEKVIQFLDKFYPELKNKGSK